jgi:hypothetical protein
VQPGMAQGHGSQSVGQIIHGTRRNLKFEI